MANPTDQKQPQPQPRVIIDPSSLSQRRTTTVPPRHRGPQDIRQTKEYKAASRRWISTIVALPILMYTSYILYDRTYGNSTQKKLVRPDGSADKGDGDGKGSSS